MENLPTYVSDSLTNRLLEFVNNLIIQEYSFEEKMRIFCTEVDCIHHTYTTFTYVNEKEMKYIFSEPFEQGIQEKDYLLTEDVRYTYWQLLNERNEIEWHDLECLSLHRAAYHSAVEKGCNAHYYIPVYTVKSH